MPEFNAAERCTLALKTEDVKLLAIHSEVMQKFKEWCQSMSPEEIDTFEETDFDGLSLGFFIAHGIIGDNINSPPEPYYDAMRLASLSRYTYEYWFS